jgi:hypothetical protein
MAISTFFLLQNMANLVHLKKEKEKVCLGHQASSKLAIVQKN